MNAHRIGPYPLWWTLEKLSEFPELNGDCIMGSTRRRFTDEYKARAVELVMSDSRSIAEIARSIDVHEMTLGKWVKKAKDEGQVPERPLNENERAELERLREENKRLRMEAEFAKKVATWFAKDER